MQVCLLQRRALFKSNLHFRIWKIARVKCSSFKDLAKYILIRVKAVNSFFQALLGSSNFSSLSVVTPKSLFFLLSNTLTLSMLVHNCSNSLPKIQRLHLSMLSLMRNVLLIYILNFCSKYLSQTLFVNDRTYNSCISK